MQLCCHAIGQNAFPSYGCVGVWCCYGIKRSTFSSYGCDCTWQALLRQWTKLFHSAASFIVCLVWPCYSVGQFFLSYECAATDTGTAFWCQVTLIYLGVSMATLSLVAVGWQSNGTNVQVRVLNGTTGPQLEIVQLSPTEGAWLSMCASVIEPGILSVLQIDCLAAFDSYSFFVLFLF